MPDLLERRLERDSQHLVNTYRVIKHQLLSEVQPRWCGRWAEGNDHGPKHIERVLGYLEDIFRPVIDDPRKLSTMEVFLAMTAVVAHDIGIATHGRAQHAKHSAAAIAKIATANEFLFDSYATDVLKTVIECHSSETSIEDACRPFPLEDKLDGWSLRPRFIAAAVRLADELDEDQRRAARWTQDLITIPETSRPYWEFCQRIRAVDVGDETITILARFEQRDVGREIVTKDGRQNFLDFFATKIAKMNAERAKAKLYLGGLARSRIVLTVSPTSGIETWTNPKSHVLSDEAATDAGIARETGRWLFSLPMGKDHWAHAETEQYASDEVKRRLLTAGSVGQLAVDDSIRLVSLNLRGDARGGDPLPARYLKPDPSVDPNDRRPTQDQLERSLEEFEPRIKRYMLDVLAQKNDGSESEWKLGMASAEAPRDVPVGSEPQLSVRALSYHVTEYFNRDLVRKRVSLAAGKSDPYPELGSFYDGAATQLFSNSQSYVFPFPSQLFVELALLSTDNQCVLVKKKPGQGVVAGIGMAWTCGPEMGLTLNDFKDGSIDVHAGVCRGLQKEFAIAPSEIAQWQIDGLAVQHVHLNSALYGHCRVALSAAEIARRFVDKVTALGQKAQFHAALAGNHSYPELVPLADIQQSFANERVRHDGAGWHPTARLRLYSLLRATNSNF